MKPGRMSGGALFLLAGALLLGAQEPGPEIRLRGIVDLSTNQLALLEVPALPGSRGQMLLAKGQRQGNVEVLAIDAAAGRVRINNGGTASELGFAAELPPGAWVQPTAGSQRIEPLKAPLSLRLQQAGPGQVFQLYQVLAQRSLIRPQSLPAFRLDVGCKDSATAADLLRAVEQALAPHGILFRPESDKFVLAGREGDFDRVTPQVREVAATLRKTRNQANPGSGDPVLVAGMIDFIGADLNQVLMIYQELAGRTLLRSSSLPPLSIAFRSYTSLTLEEALYALTATLAMNGISVLPVEEKFLFAAPTAQRQQVDALLARTMPEHSPEGKAPLPAGSLNFSNAGLRQVMAVYQELCGKPVEVPASLPEIPFTLRSQTPLTAQEALHALDLLLGWHGLTVISQDDGTGLQIVRLQLTR